MTFSDREESIFWIVSLYITFGDCGDDEIRKIVEIYRIEKFPTISKQDVDAMIQTMHSLYDADGDRIASIMRNGQ